MIQIWVKMLQRPIFGSRCNIFFAVRGWWYIILSQKFVREERVLEVRN